MHTISLRIIELAIVQWQLHTLHQKACSLIVIGFQASQLIPCPGSVGISLRDHPANFLFESVSLSVSKRVKSEKPAFERQEVFIPAPVEAAFADRAIHAAWPQGIDALLHLHRERFFRQG